MSHTLSQRAQPKASQATISKPVTATEEGFVSRLDAYVTGIASVTIGVGRSRKEDAVLPSAGITLTRTVGDPVRRGEELCVVHGESAAAVDDACRLMTGAYLISPKRPHQAPRLLEEITRA